MTSPRNQPKKRGRARTKEESEPIGWLCTVCTLINRHEMFKCEACGTRFLFYNVAISVSLHFHLIVCFQFATISF